VSGDNAAGHPHIQWLSDPAVLAPLALFAGIYIWRFRQARREAGGRGAGLPQAAAFAGAMVALLAARGVNCLVLDEPTNHLDVPAIEELERALDSFDGTVLLVTHDRRFLGGFRPTRTMELPGAALPVSR
jgi:hypothetical protein